MFRLFGTLPAAEEIAISKNVARELLRDKTYRWLDDDAVTVAIDAHLKANKIRANTRARSGVFRLVCRRVCKRVLEECAQSLSVELTSGRVNGSSQFIVHSSMSPWVLIEEHAAHLRHPEKNWGFWYSRPHREWVDKVMNIDGFASNLIEDFEAAFSDWIESHYIEKLTESNVPVRSVLYEVRSTKNAE